jgi:hypothetical protein
MISFFGQKIFWKVNTLYMIIAVKEEEIKNKKVNQRIIDISRFVLILLEAFQLWKLNKMKLLGILDQQTIISIFDLKITICL